MSLNNGRFDSFETNVFICVLQIVYSIRLLEYEFVYVILITNKGYSLLADRKKVLNGSLLIFSAFSFVCASHDVWFNACLFL